MSYDLVIFDLDGTLCDTAPDIRRCLNRALGEFDLPPLSEEALMAAIGPAGKAFLEAIVPPGTDLELAAEIVKVYRSYYEVENTVETKPFPGVVELLDGLKAAGIPQAVASNKPLGQVETIVKGLNLRDYFIDVVGPESVTNAKPDPEMLHLVMSEAGAAPERTMMVGDTHNDMTSGKNAGVTTVFVDWGYANGVAPETIDVHVKSPDEIFRLATKGK